jgi:hypothetical protein
MKNLLYRNNCNENKHIEVRVYADGHRVAKQYIATLSGRNYTGTSIRRSHVGNWTRFTQKTLDTILEDYTLVKEA